MTLQRFIKLLVTAGAVLVTLALMWIFMNYGLKILIPSLVVMGVFALMLFFRDLKTPFFYMLVVILPIYIARYLVPIPDVEHPGVLNVPVLYSYEIPLYMFLIVWLFEFVAGRGATLHLPRTTAPLALLFVPAFISTFFGLDYTFGMFELVRMAEMLLVFLMVANYLKTDRQLKIIIVLLGLSILAQSLLAGAQFLAPGQVYDFLAKFGIYMGISHARPYDPTSPIRACGTTGYCNALAGYFELTLPLFMAFFLFYPMEKKNRWLIGILLVVALAALLLTYSRGGLFSIAVGVVALLMIGARRFPQLRRDALRISLVAGAQFAIVIILFAEKLLIRLRFFMTSSMEDEVRVALIRDAVEMVKHHPFIGVGLNNYPEAFPLYEITGLKFELFYPVHNTWLLITAEQGFIGLAFFLLFMYFIYLDGRRAVRDPARFRAVTAVGLAAGLVGWAAHNLVAPLYQNWLVNRITFIFVIAVLAVLPRLRGEDADGS